MRIDRSLQLSDLGRSAAFALTVLLAASPAGATGFLIFQHGGRATGQAGAFLARAGDPSAVTYNPAAIVHLDGLQLQAGLDFTSPYDSYDSSSGGFNTNHEINFPPSLYLTWKHAADSRWALGLGIDEPMFDNLNWAPKLFPGRFLTRREEIQISELHLVSAYQLDDKWSLGLGVRYAYGRFKEGRNALISVPVGSIPVGASQFTAQEVAMSYVGNVDGLGFDASVQYKTDVWGFGAVLRSREKSSGGSSLSVDVQQTPVAPLASGQGQALDTKAYDLSFETPTQANVGVWIAPYPELRIELDAAFSQWSQVGNQYAYFPGGIGTSTLTFKDRNWKDTVSLRLGIEGDVTDAITVFGGLAFEPTPVPSSTIEPGFPRGDATVFAAGASYNFPKISFDLGWSLHHMQGRDASGQELLNPQVDSHYGSRDQAFSASVRWRFGK